MSMAAYQLCFAGYLVVLKQEIIQEIEKSQRVTLEDKESIRQLVKTIIQQDMIEIETIQNA